MLFALTKARYTSVSQVFAVINIEYWEDGAHKVYCKNAIFKSFSYILFLIMENTVLRTKIERGVEV